MLLQSTSASKNHWISQINEFVVISINNFWIFYMNWLKMTFFVFILVFMANYTITANENQKSSISNYQDISKDQSKKEIQNLSIIQ